MWFTLTCTRHIDKSKVGYFLKVKDNIIFFQNQCFAFWPAVAWSMRRSSIQPSLLYWRLSDLKKVRDNFDDSYGIFSCLNQAPKAFLLDIFWMANHHHLFSTVCLFQNWNWVTRKLLIKQKRHHYVYILQEVCIFWKKGNPFWSLWGKNNLKIVPNF